MVRTQAELAQAFGVKPRTVRNWREAGMPVRKKGGYDLVAVAEWREQHRTRPRPGAEPEGGQTLEYWEREFRRARAQLNQVELDKATGELLGRTEVEKGRVARVMAVKRALLALPRAVALEVASLTEPREVEAMLTERVRGILAQFASQSRGQGRGAGQEGK